MNHLRSVLLLLFQLLLLALTSRQRVRANCRPVTAVTAPSSSHCTSAVLQRHSASCTCYGVGGANVNCHAVRLDSVWRLTSTLSQPLRALKLYDVRLPSVTELPARCLNGSRTLELSVERSGLQQLHPQSLAGAVATSLRRLALAHNNLTRVPRLALQPLRQLVSLNLESNYIDQLVSYDLHGVPLRELSLARNRLSYVPEHSLAGLETSLRTLRLSSNHLQQFPFVAVRQLAALRRLHLADNRIATILDDGHSQLGKLATLDLSGNRLLRIGADTLAAFPALRKISLLANRIGSVHRSAFAGNRQLETLELGGNRLTRLSAGLFVHNARLKSIDLSANHLSVLPDGLLANLHELRELLLSENNLQLIGNKSLHNGTSVHVLHLHNNGIRHIESAAFVSMSQLSQLYLHNNRLHTLVDTLFIANKALTILTLDNNQLTTLGPQLFSHLVNIRELRLHYNRLTSIGRLEFRGLTSLQELHLHNNRIASVHANAFNDLQNLQYLNLQDNRLSTMSVELGVPPGSLVSLQLASNNISHLFRETFASLTKLETLSLSNNAIDIIPERVFDDLSSLLALHVHNNRLESLGNSVLSHMSSLSVLDVSNNRLTGLSAINFAGLRSLQHLNLSSAGIIDIGRSTFANLMSLTELDLNFNEIPKLQRGMFEGGIPLRRLFLRACAITEIQDGTFQDLPKLQELDLRDNMLQKLALGFMWISSLKTLSVSQNNIRQLDPNVFHGMPSIHEINMKAMNLNGVPLVLLHNTENITHIRLSKNRISHIDSSFFQNAKRLREIHLDNNQFSVLALRSLKHVEYVNLSRNKFTSLDNLFLQEVNALESLDVSFNFISQLSLKSLLNTTALKFLYLQGNQIKTVPQFSYDMLSIRHINLAYNQIENFPISDLHTNENSRLQELILTGNPIIETGQSISRGESTDKSLTLLIICRTKLTNVQSNSLSKFSQLRILRLCSNELARISPGAFRHLENLELLDLSSNHLEIFPPERVADLTALRSLNLSYNKLKSLDSFPSELQQLQSLDLSGNLISALNSDQLMSLGSLHSLNASNNRLHELNPHCFDGQPTLVHLDLSGNRIEAVPHRILHRIAVQLKAFDISDNHLRCDCHTRTLWTWLQQHERLLVNANVKCHQPSQFSGRGLISRSSLFFCPFPLVRKLNIQNENTDSLFVHWYSHNSSGLDGFRLTYRAISSPPPPQLSHDQSRRESPSLALQRSLAVAADVSSSTRSHRLEGLLPGTEYRVCVHATGQWLATERLTLMADASNERRQDRTSLVDGQCQVTRTTTAGSTGLSDHVASSLALVLGSCVALGTLFVLSVAVVCAHLSRDRPINAETSDNDVAAISSTANDKHNPTRRNSMAQYNHYPSADDSPAQKEGRQYHTGSTRSLPRASRSSHVASMESLRRDPHRSGQCRTSCAHHEAVVWSKPHDANLNSAAAEMCVASGSTESKFQDVSVSCAPHASPVLHAPENSSVDGFLVHSSDVKRDKTFSKQRLL